MRIPSQLILLFGLSVTCGSGCAPGLSSPSASPTVQATDSTSENASRVDGVPTAAQGSVSFGDFAFAIPSGWTRAKPDRSKTKVMLLLNGTVWNKADGMLMVDVGKPMRQVQGMSHAIWPVTTELRSRQDAIRVSTDSTDLSKPKHAIVIYRNNKVYLLMAAEVLGTDVSKAFESVIQTWRWNSQQQ